MLKLSINMEVPLHVTPVDNDMYDDDDDTDVQ
jgi:hypothetical protein